MRTSKPAEVSGTSGSIGGAGVRGIHGVTSGARDPHNVHDSEGRTQDFAHQRVTETDRKMLIAARSTHRPGGASRALQGKFWWKGQMSRPDSRKHLNLNWITRCVPFPSR